MACTTLKNLFKNQISYFVLPIKYIRTYSALYARELHPTMRDEQLKIKQKSATIM